MACLRDPAMHPAGTTHGQYYEEFMLKHSAMFPWGPESDEEQTEGLEDNVRSPRSPCTSRPGLGMSSKVLGESGVHLLLPEDFQQAGKILAHCQTGIDRLRYATGGMQLAVYKIGITHDAFARFELYKQNGWSKMVVLFQTQELAQVEMLEAALISHHAHTKQCRNILKGGEGMRTKMFNPRFDPPYVCYCVAARADQGRWIT